MTHKKFPLIQKIKKKESPINDQFFTPSPPKVLSDIGYYSQYHDTSLNSEFGEEPGPSPVES